MSTEDEVALAKARGDVVEDTPVDKAAEEAAKAKADEEAAKAADEAAKAKKDDKNDDPDLETEEEKAEREAEEKAKAEKLEREKKIRIPKARFDEAQLKAKRREEALQARIQELEASTGKKQADNELGILQKDVRDLQDKYEDLLLEGKKDEARKVRADLAAAQDKLSDYKSAATSSAARREAIDSLRYEETLAKLEQSYPALNPDNEEAFDEDVVTEVSDLMKALQRQGLQRHAALAKAARYVLGAPAKAEDAKNAEEVRKLREQDARKKAAEAAKKQPPDTGKAGKDSDKDGDKGVGKIDIMKLSKSAFDKLAEDKLAELRGDEVSS